MTTFSSTLKGLTWITVLRFFVRGITIVRTAILARLLVPAAFGVFGISSMTLYLMEILTETGINSFLIQEKENFHEFINTAWIVSIIRGFLISILIYSLSPLVSNFFNSPDALMLLQLTSLIPFIRGFINPACVKFQKQLEFQKEFYYRLGIIVPETAITIFMVWLTASPIGLVIGLVFSALLEVLLSFVVIYPRPRWQFERSKFMQIVHRGKWVTGYGLLDYIYTQGDNIIVGKLLGQTSLGLYQNAYKISTLPLTEIVDVFYKVLFPSYVQMLGQSDRLKRAVIKSTIVSTGLTFTAALLIYFLARPVVIVLLGSNWLSAVPAVQVLAFLGVIRGGANAFNAFFMAIKKPQYVTLITLTSSVGLLLSIFPLVQRYGIVGAGISAMIGATLALPVTAYFVVTSLLRNREQITS